MFALENLAGGLDGVGEINVVMIFQRITQPFALRFLVIDNENGWVHSTTPFTRASP